MIPGKRMFHSTRIYITIITIAQIIYQIPSIIPPTPCIPGTKGCFSVWTFIGLHKMVSDDYPGEPECNNDKCPHPLGFQYGMLSYLIIYIFCSLRDRIIQSPSYRYIEIYFEEQSDLSHERRKKYYELLNEKREEEWEEVKERRRKQNERLFTIMKHVEVYKDMMFNTGDNHILPPGQPGKPEVYDVSPTSISIKWEKAKSNGSTITKYIIEVHKFRDERVYIYIFMYLFNRKLYWIILRNVQLLVENN